ncbi:50S ribosomal protein L13 [Pelagicoccus sp. SDUM812003]|uniref:50S ribosomal protein L13 n=1 Tax=Pelagicoccus sp. SDUM812003 TaxID=3041267 RepID=UPI0028101D9A|nr:50S ribosomal protein L13 [Pelagicoccus sp. SDUM812003]MDQ8204198.1 50S ribosomal protein L13 [Pelagicoccus sp. SDUM812003]
MKTFLAKKETVQRNWYVIDAKDQVLGRLAVKIANVLRGRNKPTYTPHVDTGDFVVVINADKIALTGKKGEQKQYMFYSGYVGGEKRLSVAQMQERQPDFVVKHAVKGMLPKNRLARKMLTKLKVYAGEEHPHEAQNPEALSV